MVFGHKMLGITATNENYTYLPIIISQGILTISKGYLDSGVELDAKAIGMISVDQNTQNTQTYCRKREQDKEEIINGKTFQEIRQP